MSERCFEQVKKIEEKNEIFRKLLESQLNLMHHLTYKNISPERAMECAAVIEKILEKNK